MVCAYTRPRYQVSIYRTIGPLVVFFFKINPGTIREMKLILSIHVNNISHYINCIFYSKQIRALVALVATYYAPNFEKSGDILVLACPYVCMYVFMFEISS